MCVGVCWCVFVCVCCFLWLFVVCCCGSWSVCGCGVVCGCGSCWWCGHWFGPPCAGPLSPRPPSAGPLPADPSSTRPPLRPKFRVSLSLSLCVFSLNSGGFCEDRDPQMCTFGLSGCGVKPQLRGRRGFTRYPENSKRTGPRRFKTPPKFHEKTPRERDKKSENWWRERKKKTRNFEPSTLRGPTLRGPTLRGPAPPCMTHTRSKDWPNSIGPNWIGQNWIGPKLAGPNPRWPKMDWSNLDWQNWSNQDGQNRIGQSRCLPGKQGGGRDKKGGEEDTTQRCEHHNTRRGEHHNTRRGEHHNTRRGEHHNTRRSEHHNTHRGEHHNTHTNGTTTHKWGTCFSTDLSSSSLPRVAPSPKNPCNSTRRAMMATSIEWTATSALTCGEEEGEGASVEGGAHGKASGQTS